MPVFKVISRNDDKRNSPKPPDSGVKEKRKAIEPNILPSIDKSTVIDPAPVSVDKAVQKNTAINFYKFTPQNIQQGFIFSEILGKPRALRKGRW